jgi:tellurite resistance protein TehA-like permease
MVALHPTIGSWRAGLRRMAAEVPAGNFSFVMATGIVSIAASSQGLSRVAAALFAVNLAGFAILLVATVLRLFQPWRGFSQPDTLTVVAGLGVLGNQFAVEASLPQFAAVLWLIACVLWVVLVYALCLALATRPEKPPLHEGIDGSWLLLAVATEALAVLGTHVAGDFARPAIVAYLSLCWFLLGGFFYLVVILPIAYRWWFTALPPEDMTPPYWINMGAMAIATLAGSRLQSIADADPLLAQLLPALAAITLLCWSLATWWIPLLAGMMWWRHAVSYVPVAWGSEYWSMVFPLGMYTAATATLIRADGLGFLSWIPTIFVWIALAAWLASFAGMLGRGLRLVATEP